jgi:hypothetical protein
MFNGEALEENFRFESGKVGGGGGVGKRAGLACIAGAGLPGPRLPAQGRSRARRALAGEPHRRRALAATFRAKFANSIALIRCK